VNNSTQPQKSSLKNSINKNRLKVILNSLIILLVIIIVIITVSLIIKLQNLNEYNNIAGNKNINNKPPIQVEVLNGCGFSGAADDITDYLRNMKYDVVQIGNYKSFDIEESIIIDRKGNYKIAEDIADSLGIDKVNVIQQINKNYLLDVSIIVGKDYKQLVVKK